MPIYEYRCSSCQAELEKLQKISEPPLVECPECGKDTLVKLISASSFRLKGSGWYETDFKTGNKKNGAAEEGAGKTDKDSGTGVANASANVAAKDGDKPTSESAGKKDNATKAPVNEVKSNDAKSSSATAEAKPKSS